MPHLIICCSRCNVSGLLRGKNVAQCAPSLRDERKKVTVTSETTFFNHSSGVWESRALGVLSDRRRRKLQLFVRYFRSHYTGHIFHQVVVFKFHHLKDIRQHFEISRSSKKVILKELSLILELLRRTASVALIPWLSESPRHSLVASLEVYSWAGLNIQKQRHDRHLRAMATPHRY